METTQLSGPAVAWLQGFLHAFAWFNNKADHGYTFTFDVIPKPGTVQQAVEDFFRGELDGLTLTPIADWRGYVRGLLERWLFQFGDPSMNHLEDPRKAFSLFDDHFRGMLLDEVMGQLAEAIRPAAVWKVEVQTHSFYECGYEDLAFEEPSRVIYLHAGVSD